MNKLVLNELFEPIWLYENLGLMYIIEIIVGKHWQLKYWYNNCIFYSIWESLYIFVINLLPFLPILYTYTMCNFFFMKFLVYLILSYSIETYNV